VSADLLTLADRPDPRRFAAGLYPVRVAVRIRLTDIDVFGHVNNVAMNAIHQEARAEVLNRVWPPEHGVRPAQTIAVQHVSHFLAEGLYPGELTCHSGVARIGRTSFALATMIASADGTCLSLGDTVFVARRDGELLTMDEPTQARLRALALTP